MRAITVREPEWLEDDRDWATAQHLEEKGRCPGGCGLPLDETTGEHNQGKFHAPPPLQCHACEALYARQREWQQPDWDASDKIFHVRQVSG